VKLLTLKPAAVLKKHQALKTHNPENWIIFMPFKTSSIMQNLFEVSKNSKHHVTHCLNHHIHRHILSSQKFMLGLDSTEELAVLHLHIDTFKAISWL